MSEYGPEETPHLDTFHAVVETEIRNVFNDRIICISRELTKIEHKNVNELNSSQLDLCFDTAVLIFIHFLQDFRKNSSGQLFQSQRKFFWENR